MSLARTATRSLRTAFTTQRAASACPVCSPSPRHSFASSHPSSPVPSTSSALPFPPRARFLSTSSKARALPALDPAPPSVQPAPIANPSSSPAKPKRVMRARKAAVSLTPTAVTRIRALLDSPEPKLIRIGVRNKGCAGMSYHLDYVDKPDKFDEVVEQDGVKVVIDSKALFSIIGSEMDWQEDALQARFVFKNPNIKDACGCGESFIV
ncbi:hypothetical protein JCM10212_002905 [Sporobolomyces blumeae]